MMMCSVKYTQVPVYTHNGKHEIGYGRVVHVFSANAWCWPNKCHVLLLPTKVSWMLQSPSYCIRRPSIRYAVFGNIVRMHQHPRNGQSSCYELLVIYSFRCNSHWVMCHWMDNMWKLTILCSKMTPDIAMCANEDAWITFKHTRSLVVSLNHRHFINMVVEFHHARCLIHWGQDNMADVIFKPIF